MSEKNEGRCAGCGHAKHTTIVLGMVVCRACFLYGGSCA